ncbi:hypothetical protein BH09BAC6_BH09BAC6_19070 [soil metagenome]|jgi:hypothetical protein
MHKYNSLFFSVLVFLSACNSNKVPDGIISQKQMVNLLADVHLVDGGLFSVSQTPDTLYKYGTAQYEAVFKAHHTTAGEFKKSFRYYSKEPAQLQKMYDEVMLIFKNKTDSINKVQAKINSQPVKIPAPNPALPPITNSATPKNNNALPPK